VASPLNKRDALHHRQDRFLADGFRGGANAPLSVLKLAGLKLN
jgi:hypothetical protein